MNKFHFLKSIVFFISPVFLSLCSGTREPDYTVATTPWQEELGNHRAILSVDKPGKAVYLEIPWRRHDPSPESKKFIILEASTSDTIQNIFRIHTDNEICRLVFGPVEHPGTFFFYYLPFKPDPENGFFRYGYLPREAVPDDQWVTTNDLFDSETVHHLEKAVCRELQARTAFDSFSPMEVVPTKKEKNSFFLQHKGNYLVFPESRNDPIRMRNEIPLKWIQETPGAEFVGTVQRNEYFTFQLGLYAVKKDIRNVKFQFFDLKNEDKIIPGNSFTCFNTRGIDPYGKSFSISSDVGKDSVQAYWIGLDVKKNIIPGTYTGELKIIPENAEETVLPLKIKVTNEILDDRGDSEPWKFSRLRWLNSSLGIDNRAVKPYTPVRFDGKNRYDLKNKMIEMTDQGLPASIKVEATEVLNRPVQFNLQDQKGKMVFVGNEFNINSKAEGLVEGTWTSCSIESIMTNSVSVESDGYLDFNIQLKALSAINFSDISLEIPLKKEVARYMMGMDLPGTMVPESLQTSWEGPHDSFWIGNTHGGLHCELRGPEYHGPLLNIYHPPYPESWYNNGKGSFAIHNTKNEVLVSVHSGNRKLEAGESILFEFSLLITPVKKINTRSQFTNRYYQHYPDPSPPDHVGDAGVKIINLHHANKYNPYINYPFIATKEMKGFVDKWHGKGMKVKIYYTIRELSNHAHELWALRSLRHEILQGQKSVYPWMVENGIDKGYPWLIEHLEGDYAPAWYSRLDNGEIDASIITNSGDSRWYNYYIEGLAWLVKNIDIDGLYLDDVAYDRRIMKRIRKVMDEIKPGCMIDLHSHNTFSAGPANQYSEFFPFINKLWFGEAFRYNRMSPASWLVEVSGIPFGLMGDMLEHSGNPWLGMLFGMTCRYGWESGGVSCDPRNVWKLWDEFGIAEADMVGFWENDCPVTTNRAGVKATAYIKENWTLISLGSWETEQVKVRLNINWDRLGLDHNHVKIRAPEVENFQPERTLQSGDSIPVDPLKGWLIILEKI